MEEPKFYCPFCESELKPQNSRDSDNNVKVCSSHWDEYNCEYDTLSCDKKPLTELFLKTKELKLSQKRVRAINKYNKAVKERILELESLN